MDIAGAAGAAEKVIEDVMKVEPAVATGASMFVPGAAPVVAAVQPMVLLAVPYIERALMAIAANNGGDAFGALLDLLNHVSPGRPNSPILAQVPSTGGLGASGASGASQLGSG